MSEYRLITEIIARSVAKKWDLAKQEWIIDRIYRDDPDSCLCGHYPIVEICLLKNIKNGKRVIVGNCCVQKFIGLSSDKLFAAIKRVKANIEMPFNAEVIEYAFKKGYMDEKERIFYIETWRKRTLSPKQIGWRASINRRVLKSLESKDMI